MIVCHCHEVRDDDIRAEVRMGARDVDAVGSGCQAGTACGGCRPMVARLIADELAREGASVAVGAVPS